MTPRPAPPSRPAALQPPHRARRSAAIGVDLLEDWNALVRHGDGERLAERLASSGLRPFQRHDDGGATTPDVECDHDRADGQLAVLVHEAADDPLAARIVLQRLLPGILSIARRRGGHRRWLQRRIYDDLLANAWIVIRCYPIERRPVQVAANLLRDIEYQTIARPLRLRRVATDSWDNPRSDAALMLETCSAAPAVHPFEELVELLRHAVDAGLDAEHVRLAASLVSGATLEELARADGLTVRAERYRRARLTEALRAVVIETDDDGTAPDDTD